MTALWFLARKQLFNSLRRAKGSPRVLIPAIFLLFALLVQVGLPLMLHLFFGSRGGTHGRGGLLPAPSLGPEAFVTGGPGALIAGIRGLLLLSIFSALIAAFGEGGAGGLILSPADVDNLFPAPLSRRSVLLFKILGRWATLIIPSVYLPLALSTTLVKAWEVPSPLGYAPGLLGVWLFMASITNATQALALWRLERDAPLNDAAPDSPEARRFEALTKRRESVRRVLIALLLVLACLLLYLVVGGLGGTLGDRPGRRGGDDPLHAAAVETFLRAINGKAVGVLLAPLAWASDLFGLAFRRWQWADAGRLTGLLLLFGASVWALFSRDRDFYESAVDSTAKRARVAQAMRRGDAGTMLSEMAQAGQLGKSRREIRPVGTGAGAIVWKDLIGITRTPLRSWLVLFFIAAIPSVFGLMLGRKTSAGAILAWMPTFTLQMSSFFLLGMRDMLRRADVSKALPIAPLPFIAAELAASILTQTLLGYFSLTLSALLGVGFGPIVLAAYIAFPPLTALVLFVQAIFVLLYPQKNDAAQNAVGGLTSLLASIVALLPALLFGIGLYIAQVSPLIIGLIVALINAVCAVIALGIAAALWQRFDPTDG